MAFISEQQHFANSGLFRGAIQKTWKASRLIAARGTGLEADRILGGLCDWVEPEGAAALKAAVTTLVPH